MSDIWKSIREWILSFFGVKSATTEAEYQKNYEFTTSYEDTENINFTAIFANKLSTFVTAESQIAVIPPDDGEPTKRVDLLDETLQRLWIKSRKITSRMLGTGGIALIPYVTDGKIYFDVVAQDRISINKMQGDKIIGATILADSIFRDNKRYYRFTDYQLEGTTQVIRNKAMIDTGGSVSLDTVSEWENIPEEIRIGNVDQILFAFIKSPIDNRQTKDMYGVPITYGCAEIINQINDCLTQVEKEYKRKEVFVGVDDRLFDKTTNQLPKTGLFKGFTGAFGQSNQTFWSVFDPAFRDVSYYNRLVNLFELLEKQVGTSKGILTQPESRGATATEIKASMYDTYALIEAIRDSLERGIHDFTYACNVLANFYSLTPMAEYDIRFDWSYSLIESSSETFAQYMQAESVGAVEPAEIRMYLMSDETLEDARARVDKIKEKKATLAKALLEKTMMEDAQGLNV